jgi:carbamoyl-phosphate synthase small subunit
MSFKGWLCGAIDIVSGATEVKTDVVGYQEIATDPANAGKIIIMTMPQIGNYGANSEDNVSADSRIAGMVVREMCYEPSNWRSEQSFPDFLKDRGIVALDDVDTRAVTLHLRANPNQSARIEPVAKEVC